MTTGAELITELRETFADMIEHELIEPGQAEITLITIERALELDDMLLDRINGATTVIAGSDEDYSVDELITANATAMDEANGRWLRER